MSLYYQTNIVPCISRMTGTLLCPELVHWLIQNCPSLEHCTGSSVQTAAITAQGVYPPVKLYQLGIKLGKLSKKSLQLTFLYRQAEMFYHWCEKIMKSWPFEWCKSICVSDDSWAFLTLYGYSYCTVPTKSWKLLLA